MRNTPGAGVFLGVMLAGSVGKALADLAEFAIAVRSFVLRIVRNILPCWHRGKQDLGEGLGLGKNIGREPMIPFSTGASTSPIVRVGRNTTSWLDRAAMSGWPRVPNLGFGTGKGGPLAALFRLGTD